MIIEAIFTAIFIARPSAWLAIILLGLTLFRRWPWLANAIAHRLELDTYDGMTAYAARIALPAWSHMSSAAAPEETIAVPGTAGTAGTSAIRLPDRDISDDWIVALAEAKLPNGKRRFSAEKIFALVGGHRATVQARVKEIQECVPPPQFRQEDETTAPASYPVSKST